MLNHGEVSLDALLPPEMAKKAEAIGVKKASLDLLSMFALAVLAGAFIAMGAIFSTTVTAGSTLPYGVTRLLAGIAFSLGLTLVVVGGAELFTGNVLILMAFANGKVSFGALLRNWLVVYMGNFVGSLATALLVFLSKQYTFGGGVVGLTALNIANSKAALEFVPAVMLGILCNALVCLAVWLTYSARTTTDKILAIFSPITAFVAAGFEHSIANMYFIPLGLFIKDWAPASFWGLKALEEAGKTAASFSALTWGNFFLNNLIPVTIGNIIGGGVLVGLVYWFVYLRGHRG
ncbi:formate transporter FocA [Anaerolinea thermophila]|uniref:formate transporter FocA n=1 Tax=Anaerolinea thermophila TaxID=167964 RepID=UPI002613F9B8|nr:formate transporter FocA [Anaerolinea thermophila]